MEDVKDTGLLDADADVVKDGAENESSDTSLILVEESHREEGGTDSAQNDAPVKPPKRRKKKALIIAASIVGALLIVIICFVIYCVVNYPIDSTAMLIDNIGTITEENYADSKQRLDDATTAYNSLSASQKNKVSNAQELFTAYNTYVSFEYKTKLKAAVSSIQLNMFSIENMLDTTQTAWYNAIYRKYDEYNKGDYSDFNKALTAVYIADENVQKIKTINESYKSMDTMLERLKNPPQEYQTAYNAFIKYYSTYSVLKDMAVSPTGSYSSYTSSKNTSISNYNSAYAELKAVFPGI